jgi:hypothetical protein
VARGFPAFTAVFAVMFRPLMTLCILVSQLAPASAQTSVPSAKLRTTPIDQIVRCANSGEEAVLFSKEIAKCFPYLKGSDSVDKDMPLGVDISKVCQDPHDQRRLSANAIKLMVRQHPSNVDPTGIRIFGAIFFAKPLISSASIYRIRQSSTNPFS